MYIPIYAYHVFGSGAGSEELHIDGVRITSAVARNRGWAVRDDGHNGFVGTVSADVPISVLRAAKAVRVSGGYYPPGSSWDRTLGGLHFLATYGVRRSSRDPLSTTASVHVGPRIGSPDARHAWWEIRRARNAERARAAAREQEAARRAAWAASRVARVSEASTRYGRWSPQAVALYSGD